MNITVKPTFVVEDIEAELRELQIILLNLRHHTKLWEEHYGRKHRDNKKRWEDRADKWFATHIKTESDQQPETILP